MQLNDILSKTNNVGFINSGPGIGDNVYYSFVPESFYNTFGKKLIDVQKKWLYDNNPFVVRDVIPEYQFDIWNLSMQIPKGIFLSPANRFTKYFGWRTDTRHPRLYRYENRVKIPNSICIHTQGISTGDIMPQSIITHIDNKYKGYSIFQIGGNNDQNTPFINKRGLSLWDTADLISQCQYFIGINSGMMHMANCYPDVIKKIVLLRNDVENIYPCSSIIGTEWLDFNNLYYNTSDKDLGMTFTYRSI